MLGCVPVTSTTAVFGDAEKDYCHRVAGDAAQPATQRAAADVAIRLLRGFMQSGRMPPIVSATLHDETWERVAARWLEQVGAVGRGGPARASRR